MISTGWICSFDSPHLADNEFLHSIFTIQRWGKVGHQHMLSSAIKGERKLHVDIMILTSLVSMIIRQLKAKQSLFICQWILGCWFGINMYTSWIRFETAALYAWRDRPATFASLKQNKSLSTLPYYGAFWDAANRLLVIVFEFIYTLQSSFHPLPMKK